MMGSIVRFYGMAALRFSREKNIDTMIILIMIIIINLMRMLFFQP